MFFLVTNVVTDVHRVKLVIQHVSVGDRVPFAIDEADELAYTTKQIINMLTLC